ncbi:uncharacterized protein LOC126735523 isoform X2 [Anthonomus grandis grandis]|nr:uncharacterized protein LOC126735523 isoform X2 [Anthonomus grandis grandis]
MKRKNSDSSSLSDSSDEEAIEREIYLLKDRLKMLRKVKNKGTPSCSVKHGGQAVPDTPAWYTAPPPPPPPLPPQDPQPSTSFVPDAIDQGWFEADDNDDLSFVEQTTTSQDGGGHESGQTEPIRGIYLDPLVSKILGQDCDSSPANTDEFFPTVGHQWGNILCKGLPDEQVTTLAEKYPVPANCCPLKTPELNPEVKLNINDSAIQRDDKILKNQLQLSGAIVGIGKALSRLLIRSPLSHEKNLELLEWLSDSGRILCNLFHGQSVHRKTSILQWGFKQKLKDNFKKILHEAPISELLFGDNLSERLEQAKTLEKNSSVLVEKKNLNFKSPPPRKMVSKQITSGQRFQPRWGGHSNAQPKDRQQRSKRWSDPKKKQSQKENRKKQ